MKYHVIRGIAMKREHSNSLEKNHSRHEQDQLFAWVVSVLSVDICLSVYWPG